MSGGGGAGEASAASAAEGRREKLLSPERKSAEQMHLLQLQREKNAEATRAAKAAEEALRLQHRREREAQVRQRQATMAEERKVALESKMSKAEANRDAHVGKVASRARLESRKVDEVAFIKSYGDEERVDALDKKAQLNLKMEAAEERRLSAAAEKAAAKAEREKAAVERLEARLREVDERGGKIASKVDEAYQRWNDFTQSVADRAAANSKYRSQVMARRAEAEHEEAIEKRRALEQRMLEANERRLAHIHVLMQQARVASERSAAAQLAREARRATWADEAANSTTDGNTITTDRRSVRSDGDVGGAELEHGRERGASGGGGRASKGSSSRHGSKSRHSSRRAHHHRPASNSACSESGCSMSGDERQPGDRGGRARAERQPG